MSKNTVNRVWDRTLPLFPLSCSSLLHLLISIFRNGKSRKYNSKCRRNNLQLTAVNEKKKPVSVIITYFSTRWPVSKKKKKVVNTIIITKNVDIYFQAISRRARTQFFVNLENTLKPWLFGRILHTRRFATSWFNRFLFMFFFHSIKM